MLNCLSDGDTLSGFVALGLVPRVARASQPWAGGRNPVGIGKMRVRRSGDGTLWWQSPDASDQD